MISTLSFLCVLFTTIKSITYTIAPSDYTGSEVADYTCDGIEDEEEIQIAICKIKGFEGIYENDAMYRLCGRFNALPDQTPEVKLRGGTIKLLQGTFNVSQNIRIYSNIVFQGAGIDLTKIIISDNAPEFPNSGVIRVPLEGDNVIIQDFTVDGNKDSDIFNTSSPTSNFRYGFYVAAGSRIHFRRLRAANCPGYGFDPHGLVGSTDSTDYMIVEQCYAENNNLDGITIDKSNYVIVKDNWVFNNLRNGIELTTGSKAVHVTGNHVYGNGKNYYSATDLKFIPNCGIRIQNQENKDQYWGTGFSTVSNNYIDDSGGDGICVVEANDIVITSNIIRHSGDTCIRLRDTSYDGVNSELGADDSIVSNNLCYRNTRGIVIEDSQRVTIVGNRVSLQTPETHPGIQLKRSQRAVIHSNNLLGTQGVKESDNSENNDIVETLEDVDDIPDRTSAPTPTPTPAPTSDLSQFVPQVFNIVEDQTLSYNTDDDRIFDTLKASYEKYENGTFVLDENRKKILKPDKDFKIVNISSWQYGNELQRGMTIYMRIYLDNAVNGYYPARFEYTSDNTNNDKGVIFTSDVPSGGWVNGWNEMYHTISESDYVMKNANPNYENMDRLQLYWSPFGAWQVADPNAYIIIDCVQVGNPGSPLFGNC